MPKNHRAVAALLSFTLLLITTQSLGGQNMSQSNEVVLDFKWEWPGGRAPDYRILVRVDRLSKPGQGLFGWKKSPSLAATLPDPIDLHGVVVAGHSGWNGKKLALSLPKVELSDAGEGDTVAMGVLSQGVCICIEKAPNNLQEGDMERWLASWTCKAS
ncbi:MAG: hypothetical protein F9K25_04530 [Candidatus Contendobacter sp.]|nr:MAG: hypothetical protein F9K25_04530 [Candidatus Contendobacter sp.]